MGVYRGDLDCGRPVDRVVARFALGFCVLIRVLSCNLLGGRVSHAALRSILERHRIDVACAQELDATLSKTLARVLPEGKLAPDARGRGLGIAGRRPVSVNPLLLGCRDGLVATLSPSDWPQLRRPIEIVNVHILAPHTWPYFPRRGRRSEQVRRLVDYLDASPSTARAVVGDFNATPWWPAYRAVAARCRDAVAELHARPPRTWPNAVGLPALLRIDHCFVAGMRAERSERIPLPGSDHYGLCVDLVEIDA